MTLIETILESFREKFYYMIPPKNNTGESGVLNANDFEQLETFLRASLQTIHEKTVEEAIEMVNERKTNPTTQHSYFNAAMDLILSDLSTLKSPSPKP